jgi:metal-responsive CopG/Arc/MetJ family transcriptional regulator
MGHTLKNKEEDMNAIKTSISFEPELFKHTDEVAHEMNLSRSKLVALALENFFMQRESKRLFEKINVAHADGLDPTEKTLLKDIRRQQLRRSEGTW